MKEELDIDYERDCKIDHDNLDIEWIEQPELARKYAKYLAHVRSEVNKLEEEKKIVRADLIDKINRNPEEYTSKTKPNASDIEAAYIREDEFKQIQQELIEKKEELEYAELAYQQVAWSRKKSLEWISQLWMAEYFSGPKAPRDLNSRIEKKRQNSKEANKSISLNRKSKNSKE
jgi:hypothetical protein